MSGRVLIVVLTLVLAFGAFGIYMSIHQHDGDPKLRADCEARGGMLIHTKGGHACVGRPQPQGIENE